MMGKGREYLVRAALDERTEAPPSPRSTFSLRTIRIRDAAPRRVRRENDTMSRSRSTTPIMGMGVSGAHLGGAPRLPAPPGAPRKSRRERKPWEDDDDWIESEDRERGSRGLGRELASRERAAASAAAAAAAASAAAASTGGVAAAAAAASATTAVQVQERVPSPKKLLF